MDFNVVIPFINNIDITKRCIEVLEENSHDVNIIPFDNGSTEPYDFDAIRSEENIGCYPSLLRTLDSLPDGLFLFMHNDVLIHEKNWDLRVRKEFETNEKLALAGFFGAPGVGQDGGRMNAHSNMAGKEWGSSWSVHGGLMTETTPAAVIDSLAMIFNTNLVRDLIPRNLPPHHWFDRIIPLTLIDAGFHVATIGIEFDHGGGMTSTKQEYHDFVNKWGKENGLKGNYDLEMYELGLRIFRQWNSRLPLTVDPDYTYRWYS
jgi:hypothetical protein